MPPVAETSAQACVHNAATRPLVLAPDPKYAPPVPAHPFTIAHASFLYAIAPGSSAPETDVPEIAFAGRSNVGKSSLMNRLMSRRNLVRTSSTPGCTRQINIFETRLADGPTLRLVDLPGFGFAKRSKDERVQWGALIEGYLTNRSSLRSIVLVVDARRGIEHEEQMLVDFVRDARAASPVRLLCVATKTDKLPRSQVAATCSAIHKASGLSTTGFSAQSGEGRERVWRAILASLTPTS